MNALKTNPSPDKRSGGVEYVPPSEKKIENYAASVCQKFGEQQPSDVPDREIRQGFTDFIKLAVKIETKLRNPGGHRVKQ